MPTNIRENHPPSTQFVFTEYSHSKSYKAITASNPKPQKLVFIFFS